MVKVFLEIRNCQGICSLENAGENSVVSILGYVRSVWGLIHLNISRGSSSSLGISHQVLFLVHFSFLWT
jgi:hypothetical protein